MTLEQISKAINESIEKPEGIEVSFSVTESGLLKCHAILTYHGIVLSKEPDLIANSSNAIDYMTLMARDAIKAIKGSLKDLP